MLDAETPYRPPNEEHRSSAASPRRHTPAGFAIAAFVGLPMFGGMLGFFGYIIASLVIETRIVPTEPSLSYGQTAMFISLPLCTVIAASTGFALAFAVVRSYGMSIVLLLLICACGTGVTYGMWNDSTIQYGSDPSDAVLFYPPLGFAASACLVAILVGIVGITRR